MIDRRSAARRFIEVELPVLVILAFALAPYAWMVLTSIKPQAELATWPVQYLPRNATLEHYRDASQPHELRRQPLQQPHHRDGRCRARSRRCDPGGLRLLALPLSRPAGADDRLSRHQHVSDRAAHHPALRPHEAARAPRHLPRCHPRPFDIRDSLRDLDADELLQRHPAGSRRSGDDRWRDAARDDPHDHPAARRCRASRRPASISSSPPGTNTSSP